MKQIFWFCLLFTAFSVSAQSFHRGAVVFDANAGMDVFNTTKVYKDVFGFDTTVPGQTANKNLSAGVEIGIGKRFGIGARGRLNTFFSEMDKVVHEKAIVNSADLLLNANLHPIVIRNLDFVVGAELGMSSIDLNFGNSKSITTSGKGGYAAFYLNPRFYFGRFGFNVRASLPFAEYRNLETVNTSKIPSKFDLDYWKGKGFGFSVGLQVRLF